MAASGVRTGRVDLSTFADEIEKAQAARHKQVSAASSKSGPIKASAAASSAVDQFDELSFIDSLGLSDDAGTCVKLRDQLLGQVPGLDKILNLRLEEGRGEGRS